MFIIRNFFTTILFFSFTTTFAQVKDSISFSVNLGVNVSKSYQLVDGKPPQVPIPNSCLKPGLGLSFLANIPVCRCISLNTGLSYTYISSEFHITPPDPDIIYAGQPLIMSYSAPEYSNYIGIPLQLKLNLSTSKRSVYVIAGTEIMCCVHSAINLNFNNYPINQQIMVFTYKQENQWGYNYTLALGKNFDLSGQRFFIEIRYSHDLSSWNYQLIPANTNYTYSGLSVAIRNYSALLSLGWII